LAVARTLGFSCFGFFTSLFPRLLLPFPITTSRVEMPLWRHARRIDPQQDQGCLLSCRAMTSMSCTWPCLGPQHVTQVKLPLAVTQGFESNRRRTSASSSATDICGVHRYRASDGRWGGHPLARGRAQLTGWS
jgi:hypothetical protein